MVPSNFWLWRTTIAGVNDLLNRENVEKSRIGILRRFQSSDKRVYQNGAIES